MIKKAILSQNSEQVWNWSIGIYSGDSPQDLKPEGSALNPVLSCNDVTDIPAAFVADPFMIRIEEVWYMFMEIVNKETGLGEIGMATSDDGYKWKYECIVLKEAYHLSYPFVFKYQGAYFMVPETLGANAVRLYKAVNFPYDWKFGTNLTEGKYADPTLFYHDKLWWMFASKFPNSETLNLFYADDPMGPFIQHPLSPLIENDNRRARPAGRVNLANGSLIRLCQDCYPIYGTRVRAFEITELTKTNYSERELPESPILHESAAGGQWNSRGMHHMDVHQTESGRWLACVDGCYDDRPEMEKRAVWIFDESFKTPAYLSVASFREHVNIPVALFYLGTLSPELVNEFKSLGGEIDFIAGDDIGHETPESADHYKKNGLVRMEVMQMWPKEVVFLFDAGTIFSKNIAPLFSFVDNLFKNADREQSVVGGIEQERGVHDCYTMKRNEEEKSSGIPEEEVSASFQEVFGQSRSKKFGGLVFSSRVLLMYNCVELATLWRSHYLYGVGHSKVNTGDDLFPLIAAINDLKIPVLKLDSMYCS